MRHAGQLRGRGRDLDRRHVWRRRRELAAGRHVVRAQLIWRVTYRCERRASLTTRRGACAMCIAARVACVVRAAFTFPSRASRARACVERAAFTFLPGSRGEGRPASAPLASRRLVLATVTAAVALSSRRWLSSRQRASWRGGVCRHDAPLSHSIHPTVTRRATPHLALLRSS